MLNLMKPSGINSPLLLRPQLPMGHTSKKKKTLWSPDSRQAQPPNTSQRGFLALLKRSDTSSLQSNHVAAGGGERETAPATSTHTKKKTQDDFLLPPLRKQRTPRN